MKYISAVVVVVIVILLGLVSGKNDKDDLISVLQLIPQNNSNLLALISLFEDGQLDFWRAPSKIGSTVDIMVDSKDKKFLETFAAKHKIPIKVIVNDLNKLIADKEGDNTESWSSKALRRLNGGRRDLGDIGDNRKEDFGLSMKEYHSYPEIVEWMHRIESRLGPSNAKVFSIGRTVEGRETYGIKFTSSNPVSSASSSSGGGGGSSLKRVVWIDGGIHAREWTAIHTSVYTIFNLANGILKNDTKLMKMLETIEIVVFPVLNPDGYEYTRSDPRNALIRMWRKSRSHERCATNRNGEKSCCRGTDLNRNFAYKFAEVGTSSHPCSEIYHGAGPFSEPESRNVRDAIINSELTGRIDAYVTLHAYSQLFIYPYSNRKRHYPEDVAELKKVAQKAVSAISRLFGTHYLIGTGPEIIYSYAGGSSDWAKETAKIKYSYTIELRPSYYSWNGFVLDKTLLIPTARETFDGIMVVLDTVASEARDKMTGNIRSSTISPPPSFIPSQTRQTSPPPRIPTFQHQQPQQQQQHFQNFRQQQSFSCRDSVEDCERWLLHSPHLCSTSRISMKKQCPKTCNLC